MQLKADAMAERLRTGLRNIVDKYEVNACVYGESSTFHIYFGAKSIDDLDARSLKSAPPEVQTNFRQGLQVSVVGPVLLLLEAAGLDSFVEPTLTCSPMHISHS